MRKILGFLLVLALLCGLCGCASLREAQTVTVQDLSITLPGTFKNLASEPFDGFSYGMADIMVLGIREAKTLFGGQDIPESAKAYGEMVLRNNNLDSVLQEQDGVVTFTFSSQSEEHTYSYLAAVYQGTDSFWLVQIGCLEKNFEGYRENFLNYLKSVTVS